MAIDRKLLEILRCPVTKLPLSILAPDKLKKLNDAIANGEVHYVDGAKVDKALQAALITDNGRTIYRIDDDIPVMLEDQGIGTEQFVDF